MLVIKPLIFYWQGFSAKYPCSDEEAGERSQRTASILQFPFSALGVK
ncbi:MAG: hypothetical protein ACTS73_02435 [Arsenophonus sp. NEOnobi-MAG3]